MHRAWFLTAAIAGMLVSPPEPALTQEPTPAAAEASPAPALTLLDPSHPTPTPVVFDAPPAPTECTVAPRPVEDFVVTTEAPAAAPEPPSAASEAELPQGPSADPETVAAIEALERELAACYNAGDWRRILAFYTDDVLRAVLASYGADGADDIAADFLAPPQPLDKLDRLVVDVRDVRLLPDGRVGALVDHCGPVSFHVYERSGGRWLIAHEIGFDLPNRTYCVFPLTFEGTPAPLQPT